MSEILDCGHPATETNGPGTGYAITPDGRKICYADSNEEERKAFAEATVYSAYADERKGIITTWPGATLATITRVQHDARRWTPNGGSYRMRHVWATAPDGAHWYGRG